jgi:hypothetical protein
MWISQIEVKSRRKTYLLRVQGLFHLAIQHTPSNPNISLLLGVF